MHACRVCGSAAEHPVYQVPEMLAFTGEVFEYFQCSTCGCLQIASIPGDLGHYYEGVYYAFTPPRFSPQERFARRLRDAYCLTGKGAIGRFLSDRLPNSKLEILRLAGIRPESRILDVGAGSGYLLGILWDHGFRNVEGVDPFLPSDVEFRPGARVRKVAIEDAEGNRDLVVFNHSLEHMTDPVAPLRRARDLLRPDGRCVVRIPTCEGLAWETYREHWASIDAPRHIHLHSRESFRRTAAQAGFRIEGEMWDSEAFQFWASEQGLRGLPHRASNSASRFSPEEMRGFARRAADLNRIGRGDQVGYILAPA